MRASFLALALAACAPPPSPGLDWPQWRGERRDGVWRETGLAEKFSSPLLRWKAPLGAGYCGPTVAAGRVYVMDRLKDPVSTERVHCLDWKTGATLWTRSYEAAYEGFAYTAGPRASVTVHDGRAYALGAAGHLHALDAATGAVLWKRDLRAERRIRMPRWGIAASPLVEGDLLITQIAGEGEACVVALDRFSGRDRWAALPDEAAYSAPIAIDQAGRRVVVCAVADRLVGLDAPTGALLWSYAMPGSSWPISISTPAVEKDLLFFTTAHVGSVLLRLRSDAPAVDVVWRNDGRRTRSPDTLHSLIPTPLVMNGFIFGAHGRGELRCLELMTGKRAWEDTRANPPANSSTFHLVRHGDRGDRAWIFNEKGELILARLTGAGYEEISRARLLEPTTEQHPRGVAWSHPAFAYGHVFARNDREIVCVDLRAQEPALLSIELVDAATGHPLPGLVRAEDAAGAPVELPGLLSRGLGLEKTHAARRWSVVPGPVSVRVPRGKLRLEAFHGLETELARVDVDLSGDAAVARIPLRRFHEPEWRNANTHLHLQKVPRLEADRYLQEVSRADGLDLVFVSYLERAEADRDYVTNAYTEADLRALSESSGVLFGNGEEHRHNFSGFGEGYGHVMFLNLPKLVFPVSIGPGIMKTGTDGRPLQPGIDEARKQGATAIWCHNRFGLEDIPNWLAGRPHAQNIFDGDPAAHGSYDETFYRYLNAGLRVPFSTGTDWFIYDFSRVYAPVPDLRTPRDWLKELEAGRTFITNGPFLEFTVEGRSIGDTLKLDAAAPLRVRARAAGRVDFRRIELVRNGEVLRSAESRPQGRHFVADLELSLETAEPCWLALRIPPDGGARSELGGPLFAHTSPVYVEVAGRGLFREDVARGLLDELRRAKETIAKAAVFADGHERAHVLSVYDRAIEALGETLKAGGR